MRREQDGAARRACPPLRERSAVQRWIPIEQAATTAALAGKHTPGPGVGGAAVRRGLVLTASGGSRGIIPPIDERSVARLEFTRRCCLGLARCAAAHRPGHRRWDASCFMTNLVVASKRYQGPEHRSLDRRRAPIQHVRALRRVSVTLPRSRAADTDQDHDSMPKSGEGSSEAARIRGGDASIEAALLDDLSNAWIESTNTKIRSSPESPTTSR